MAVQPRCAAVGITLAYVAKSRKGWVAVATGRLAQIRTGRDARLGLAAGGRRRGGSAGVQPAFSRRSAGVQPVGDR